MKQIAKDASNSNQKNSTYWGSHPQRQGRDDPTTKNLVRGNFTKSSNGTKSIEGDPIVTSVLINQGDSVVKLNILPLR